MTAETLATKTRPHVNHSRELTEYEKQVLGDYVTSLSTPLPTLRAKSSIIYALAEMMLKEGKLHCWITEHEVAAIACDNKLAYCGSPIDYFDLRQLLKEAFRFSKLIYSGQYEIRRRENGKQNGEVGVQLDQAYWFDLDPDNLRLIEYFIAGLKNRQPLNAPNDKREPTG